MKPFNLEQALAGEPVLLLNNNPPLKAYLSRSKLRDDGIIVEFEDENRTVRRHSEKWIKDFGANIVMWEEPRPRVTLTLPCLLKEPQEDMWLIYNGKVFKSDLTLSDFIEAPAKFKQRLYFVTREDAQEWVDAIEGARR